MTRPKPAPKPQVGDIVRTSGSYGHRYINQCRVCGCIMSFGDTVTCSHCGANYKIVTEEFYVLTALSG